MSELIRGLADSAKAKNDEITRLRAELTDIAADRERFIAMVTEDKTKLRAELGRVTGLVLDAHGQALPPNWVYSDTQTTLDLLVAEITTLREEKKQVERERDALREALQQIADGCVKCFAEGVPSGDYEPTLDRALGKRSAWAVAGKIANAALIASPQPPAPDPAPEGPECSICGGPVNHKGTCGGTGRAQ